MNTLATVPWNLVTNHFHGHELLRKKIREKITRLEKHLKHFPPDTVHLHIALERDLKKEHYTAELTLRLPSNILHSGKSADDVIIAFDDAVKALLRGLESLKSDLRHEKSWKRKARREQPREASGFAAVPQAEGTGPQKYEDVVRELFQQHYKELMRHARRHIGYAELAGDIPRDALKAADIVDEVARRAVAKAAQRRKGMSWMVWFYHLIHEELQRHRRRFKRKRVEEVSIDETKTLPEDADKAAGYDASLPLDIIQEELEPPGVPAEALVPDPRAVPPDQIVAQKDLLLQVQQDKRNWPRPEREIFEL